MSQLLTLGLTEQGCAAAQADMDLLFLAAN